MPCPRKSEASSLTRSCRRKSTKDTQKKKMVKSRSKSIRPGHKDGEIFVGMILNPKFKKNQKTSASEKRTKCNTTPISNPNKNIIRKQVSRPVKKKKNEERFIHEIPKKICNRPTIKSKPKRKKMPIKKRKQAKVQVWVQVHPNLLKTNNKKQTQKKKNANSKNGTRKSTGLSSSSSKFIRDLKHLFSANLMKSQYCNANNDIDQVHLTKSLIETISYPKFVFDDIEQDSNSRHGKQNNNKLYMNEMDVLSRTDNKDTTSELHSSHSKPKRCPETYLNMNDLKKEQIPSSLDYCCANGSKTSNCKTGTENNAKAYPDNNNNLNNISHSKLIYKLNIEFDRMQNNKCSNHLFAKSESTKTSFDVNNEYSDVNDHVDDIFIATKEEMENDFVRGCDLVFDTFKDKVFETVYADHLASVHYLQRLLRA